MAEGAGAADYLLHLKGSPKAKGLFAEGKLAVKMFLFARSKRPGAGGLFGNDIQLCEEGVGPHSAGINTLKNVLTA